jgi:hypothetical protein
LGTVEAFAVAAAQIDLAVRNVRVLARGAVRALSLADNVPLDVADAIEDLASAVLELERALDDDGSAEPVRGLALRAATTASLVLERTGNLSVSVIVGQIRSTAVDLLAGWRATKRSRPSGPRSEREPPPANVNSASTGMGQIASRVARRGCVTFLRQDLSFVTHPPSLTCCR